GCGDPRPRSTGAPAATVPGGDRRKEFLATAAAPKPSARAVPARGAARDPRHQAHGRVLAREAVQRGRARADAGPPVAGAVPAPGSQTLMATGSPLAWGVFAAVIIVMLALDLGVFHRKAHVIGAREAAIWSAVWIGVALLFNLAIYFHSGSDRALEFFQAWLIEKALSVDNLFVFLVAFSYFAVPPHLQHRVLFWGIIGALITRGVFIAIGAALLSNFHFVMYIFGAFLIFTAVRLLRGGEEEPHPEKNPVLRLFRRFVRITKEYEGTHFFVRQNGQLYATPLLMGLVVLEAAGVAVAVGLIPAVVGGP